MRQAWNKLVRDTLEQQVIRKYKKSHLNFDQYLGRVRFPVVPRIVVFSHSQSLDNYLQKVFPLYTYVRPSTTLQSDEISARKVAEQLTTLKGTSSGYLIKGFPLNINQALLLDKYLNGVNLAIHLKDQNCTKGDEQINNLLNYYDSRGTLIRLPLHSNPTAEQLEFATRQIITNIKLSQ